jgi:phosphate transport system substrate-binding protein
MLGALGQAVGRFSEQFAIPVELAPAEASAALAGLASGRFHVALLLDALPARAAPSLVSHLIAYDAIALIANGLNPTQGLSRAQVAAIYSAAGAAWPRVAGKAAAGNGAGAAAGNGAGAAAIEGKPVVRLVREATQPERKLFEESLDIKRSGDEAVHVVAGGLASILFVAVDPLAIGYVSAALAAQMAAEGARIKVLALDGVMPTAASLIDGRYPMRRAIDLVTPRAPSRDAQRLAAFLRGGEVAVALRAAGYAPVLP